MCGSGSLTRPQNGVDVARPRPRVCVSVGARAAHGGARPRRPSRDETEERARLSSVNLMDAQNSPTAPLRSPSHQNYLRPPSRTNACPHAISRDTSSWGSGVPIYTGAGRSKRGLRSPPNEYSRDRSLGTWSLLIRPIPQRCCAFSCGSRSGLSASPLPSLSSRAYSLKSSREHA